MLSEFWNLSDSPVQRIMMLMLFGLPRSSLRALRLIIISRMLMPGLLGQIVLMGLSIWSAALILLVPRMISILRMQSSKQLSGVLSVGLILGEFLVLPELLNSLFTK